MTGLTSVSLSKTTFLDTDMMSDVEKQDGVEVGTKVDVVDDTSSTTAGRGEVLSLEDVDPALDAKMHLVNNVRVFFRVFMDPAHSSF